MKTKVLTYLKKLLPHVLIIFGFFVITVLYFSPAFEGKVLRQMDAEHFKAMSQEPKHLYEQTGHYSLWNNSVFSGMPNYQIYAPPKSDPNIFRIVREILALFYILPYSTAAILFLYFLGMYLLLLTLRFDKWLSAVLALAFGFSSYNIIIIAVGHITKAYAIGYMPLVLASFILLYDYRQYLWGTLALTISLGTQISTTHVQIVYYTAILIAIYVIYKFIKDWIINKQSKHFIIASAVAIIGVILALGPNFMKLWETYELGKYSIRGGQSEVQGGKKQKGLDKSYAMAWSYGVSETLTLMIPDIKGGESDYIGNDPQLMQKITSPFKQYIAQSPRYWGPQTFTAGPVYFGAIIIFLFVLGMFIVKDDAKWWLFAATLLSIMLAWGGHFKLLTNLFWNYVPLYNKFRVPSMILVIASLTVIIISAMAIKEIVENPKIISEKAKYFYISFGLTAGVALLIYLIPKLAGSLLSPQEQEYLKTVISQNPANAGQIQRFFNDLEAVRAMIVKASAIRSFLFITLAAVLIWAYSKFFYKNPQWLYLGLGLLIVIDLWSIDTRYLGYKDFKPRRVVKNDIKPTPADIFIQKTQQKDYRVLNLTVDPFNDAMTSAFHQHIGGYSAAKLRRYQDIIDFYLRPYAITIVQALKDSTAGIMDVIRPMQVLHMLNTLYIIVDPNSVPIINPYAYGNAWFVDSYKFVNTPKEEIEALNEVDLKRTAVINRKKYENIKFPELSLNADPERKIVLSYYQPDSLVYRTHSANTEFAVFSEVYYPEGWHAYIDGKEVPIINTDFILRGVIVPAGDHTIIMVFKPAAYYVGRKISQLASLIVLLILIGGIGYEIYKSAKKQKHEA